MSKEPKFLRRYTELPQLIHMLRTRSIPLSDPSTWDDKNDDSTIDQYREKRKLAKVYALCLTEASETYHHWKIYAGSLSGVCVEFHKDRFIAGLPKDSGFRHGPVHYVRIDDLTKYRGQVSKWPFLKRRPFSGEQEYRVIYKQPEKDSPVPMLKLELKSISHIYLSPWVHKDTADFVAEMIRYLPLCSELNVSKTTLVSNKRWCGALKAK